MQNRYYIEPVGQFGPKVIHLFPHRHGEMGILRQLSEAAS